ncbi:MAG: TetR family transcriptional regulator [Brotaphodocola sp.]
MPTERFYRLSEEKQKLIYEAAKKEFARVPYEKASINQIVKNADISRGSFYTYFEDKEDAMKYVMKENFTQMRNVCEDALKRNNGEYLGMLKTLFEYFVEKMQNTKEVMVMVENVFGRKEMDEFSCHVEDFFEFEAEENGAKTYRSWLEEHMNCNKMRVQNPEEVHSMISLGEGALYSSLRQYYLHPEKAGAIRESFEIKLDIISHGAYRVQVAEAQ